MARKKTPISPPSDPVVYFTAEQIERSREKHAAARKIRIERLAGSLFGAPGAGHGI
jgi:hypothetical protein